MSMWEFFDKHEVLAFCAIWAIGMIGCAFGHGIGEALKNRGNK